MNHIGKSKRIKIKISLTIFMILICSFSFFSVKEAKAEEIQIYRDDNCRIAFKINSIWTNGMEGQFIIDNLWDKPWKNWKFQVTFRHNITKIKNGIIKYENNNVYVIQHSSANKEIPARGRTVVDFTGQKDGKVMFPFDCFMIKREGILTEKDYSIGCEILSKNKKYIKGDITITNHSAEVIEGWKLELKFPYHIICGALGYEETHYTFISAFETYYIQPGETIYLCFEAKNNPKIKMDDINKAMECKFTACNLSKIEDEATLYDYSDEELKIDTDKDKIPDFYEKYELRTNPKDPDTDGDGLRDGLELFYFGSNPLIKDSDLDCDEDGLANLEEYKLGTDPQIEDSDSDELTDYEEVKIYHTNPNEADTDGDGINDKNEMDLGFNPKKKDTDGNGVEDGNEKVKQTLVEKYNNDEEFYKGLKSIRIDGLFTKYINYTTEIRTDGDVYSDNLVGLVGVPLVFETESKFDKANICITYKYLPKGKKVKDLGVLWSNEKEGRYEVLKSKVNAKKKSISFEIEHTGSFIVVDIKEWNGIWDNPITHGDSKKATDSCDLAFIYHITERKENLWLKEIQDAMYELTDIMMPGEKEILLEYSSSMLRQLQGLTSDRKKIKNAIEQLKVRKAGEIKEFKVSSDGIKKGIKELRKGDKTNGKILYIISDKDICYNEQVVNQARQEHVKIFVINISKKNKLKDLKKYTKKTEGFYYSLKNRRDIQGILFEIKHIVLEGIDTTDTDGDGLFDVYEKKGVRVLNGRVIKLNPYKKDTDEDGQTDLEEMGYPVWIKKESGNNKGIEGYRTFFRSYI